VAANHGWDVGGLKTISLLFSGFGSAMLKMLQGRVAASSTAVAY
jgi:hypothetical protein